jgi:cation diffusion facilitator family transporter
VAAGRSSKVVIYAALLGNLLVAITKFAAAALTGSSAMTSEGVHSLVDTANQALLLYGTHRAARPPDDAHPLGYGRELYFWSFIVALLIFSTGAGVSLFEGISHVLQPTPITNPLVNYVVLGLSFVFEGTSWSIAVREFNGERGRMRVVDAVMASKNPTTFTVLFEDTAALIGIGIAVMGTFLTEQFNAPVFDGAASIGIGIILAITAALLARESKSLLLGEPARESVRKSLQEIAGHQLGVEHAFNLFTVHLAPDQIVVGIDLDFDDRLSASGIEQTVRALEERIKRRHPSVVALFVKPRPADDPKAPPAPDPTPL